MWVVCIDDYYNNLTLGKAYKVLCFYEDCYKILNDLNQQVDYFTGIFATIDSKYEKLGDLLFNE